MLSDHTKRNIANGIKQLAPLFGDQIAAQIGPRKIVDFVIANSRHQDLREEMNRNRLEAEQYIAGLLGMM